MGLLDEFLKGLPTNPNLREKAAEAERKYAALETENAILKDDLRDANAKIKQLEKQIDKVSQKQNPNEMEVAMLKAISTYEQLTDKEIAELLKLNLQRARYHLQKLQDNGYLSRAKRLAAGRSRPFQLTHDGRGFLIGLDLL